MKKRSVILSRTLEVFFIVLIIGTIISTLVQWFSPQSFMNAAWVAHVEQTTGFNFYKLTWTQRLPLYVLGAITSAVMLYGLWIGVKIARLIRTTTILSDESVELFAKLKTTAMVFGLLTIVNYVYSILYLMPKMEPKMKLLSFIGTALGQLMIIGFFAAITALIKRGARLRKEQDLTV